MDIINKDTFDTFLLNASTEQIQKLTNKLLPQVYNNLFKNTEPNSIERKHWLEYCKIIHIMELIKANNSEIIFKFYYNNPNKFYHNKYSIEGRKQCHEILMNIWEYVNKDDIYIKLTKELFGNKVYDYYKFICEDEGINENNLYISNINVNKEYNKEYKNLTIICKIIFNN